jgi:lipooligosaccharide transport system ATP-binding protein
MSQNIISVQNISKHFPGGLCAVDKLSFEVPSARCFGFLGPNGAGKTTMMKMLYARCKRNKKCPGTIKVFGYEPGKDQLSIKYLSGVVPQEDNLDEELNVRQNLMIYSSFYGISSKKAKKRIDQLLEFLELNNKADAKIRQLSGGMKRRLVIARALLNEPKLLILDEPTTGLDPQVRHLIWDKLRQLKRSGTTILLTTHYMEEAYQLCDLLIIMHKGRKIMEGDPRKLLAEKIEKFVLELHYSQWINCLEDNPVLKNVRVEKSGQTGRLYSDDIEQLKMISEMVNDSEYRLRQSNLEDIFLKATGSTLNDIQ